MKKAFHPQDGSDREIHLPLPAAVWDIPRKKEQVGKQDVSSEAAALAQQIVFALDDSLDSLLLFHVIYFQVPPLGTWVLAALKYNSSSVFVSSETFLWEKSLYFYSSRACTCSS